MTPKEQTLRSNKKHLAVGIYAALVIGVFGALMWLLFFRAVKQDTINTSETILATAQSSIITEIVDNYAPDASSQNNTAARPQNNIDTTTKLVRTSTEPAWTQNAAIWRTSDKPMIAIIIDDLGLLEKATIQLAAMEGPYTLAYLPYAEDLRGQTARIRSAGHELMVHLPMQSQRTSADPGDNALLEGLPFDEFAKRIEWNLSRFEGYVGINNHMGSKLTEDPGLMVRVMARLKRDGFLFVDSLTTPDSVGARAAKATNVPYVKRDVFLDNERDSAYIQRQLATAERIARMRGYAVAIGHPYPETLTTLTEWQKTLDLKGLIMVPISQIVNIVMEQQASVPQ